MTIIGLRQCMMPLAVAAVMVVSALSVATAQPEDETAEPATSEVSEAVADEAELVVEEAEGTAPDEGAPVDGDPAETDALADELTEASDEAGMATEEGSRDWGRLQPIADLVAAGGWVIVVLLGLSVLSLMVIVVKFVQFRILRLGAYRFTEKVSALLSEGDQEGALAFLQNRRGVVARVMETALRGKLLGGDDVAAREETERVAKAKLDGLERGLPLLNLIATISPLLGLLGTVLGMIEAFQQLETAGDRVDPAILSGGIWEALLTTAAGLTVAIPAAAFFTWLQRSVDVAAQHMEDAAIRVFTSSLYDRAGSSDAHSDEA